MVEYELGLAPIRRSLDASAECWDQQSPRSADLAISWPWDQGVDRLSGESLAAHDRDEDADNDRCEERDRWPLWRGPQETRNSCPNEPGQLQGYQADADPNSPRGGEVGPPRLGMCRHSNASKNGGKVPMTPKMPSPKPM